MEFDPAIFGAGLGFGLLVTLVSWVNQWRAQSVLKGELNELKKHLQTQLSITAKGYEETQQEIKRLKQENENLRATVGTLSNKPGRAELKTLQVWDKALRSTTVRVPGFAPAWELAVAEAQKEMQGDRYGRQGIGTSRFPNDAARAEQPRSRRNQRQLIGPLPEHLAQQRLNLTAKRPALRELG